jgi:hypothetical protein
MSTPTALARYNPADNAANRPALRTDPRYRAGVVMELLEIRRVLSAAVNAAVLDLGAPDDSAIVVDDCTANDAATADGVVAEGGSDGGVDGASGAGELTIMNLNVGATDGAVDATDAGDGFDWPEGWAWTLDHDPTQADVDALDAGDDTNWVPVRTFGGIAGTEVGDDLGANDGEEIVDLDDAPPTDDASDLDDAPPTDYDGGPVLIAIFDENDDDDVFRVDFGLDFYGYGGNVGDPGPTLGESIQNWPSGYVWTLDAAPTQADADAFDAGDTTGWFNLNDLGVFDGVDVGERLATANETRAWGVDDGASGDEDGYLFLWPEGYTWNEERPPTPDDVDAFDAGDATGWISIPDALGISAQAWDDYNAQNIASIDWWYETDYANPQDWGQTVYITNANMFGRDAAGAPAPGAESPEATKEPAAAGDSPEQSFGGVPQFAAASFATTGADFTGSILFGKLKKNVTDDDPSDLPFMN